VGFHAFSCSPQDGARAGARLFDAAHLAGKKRGQNAARGRASGAMRSAGQGVPLRGGALGLPRELERAMVDPLDFTRKAAVLVVDDTPSNLSLIAGLLKDQYTVRVANDGEKGLQLARSENRPDLILLDVMMPEMSGYEVCKQLKSDPATQDIPIVFLTALAEAEDEKRGLELGAVDYITKPVSPPILLARVKTQLQVKAVTDFLRDKNEYLEQQLKDSDRSNPQVDALLKLVEDLLAMKQSFLSQDR
jgi:putative two-component system response regulator